MRVLFTLGWRSLLGFHILWAAGALTFFGVEGFAKDTDVDKKISAAMAPIKQDLTEQREILTTVATQLKITLSEGKATEIRLLARQRCPAQRTAMTDLESLNKEIERKQEEYAKLVGQRYNIPTCGDLL